MDILFKKSFGGEMRSLESIGWRGRAVAAEGLAGIVCLSPVSVKLA
jgi:hypothetical protein